MCVHHRARLDYYSRRFTLSTSSVCKRQQSGTDRILEINSAPRIYARLVRLLWVVRFQVVNKNVGLFRRTVALGNVWRHAGDIVRMKRAECLDRFDIVRVLSNHALRLEQNVLRRQRPPRPRVHLHGGRRRRRQVMCASPTGIKAGQKANNKEH